MLLQQEIATSYKCGKCGFFLTDNLEFRKVERRYRLVDGQIGNVPDRCPICYPATFISCGNQLYDWKRLD